MGFALVVGSGHILLVVANFDLQRHASQSLRQSPHQSYGLPSASHPVVSKLAKAGGVVLAGPFIDDDVFFHRWCIQLAMLQALKMLLGG
jgi:hypothetical protein